jgi:hypothetical protein
MWPDILKPPRFGSGARLLAALSSISVAVIFFLIVVIRALHDSGGIATIS